MACDQLVGLREEIRHLSKEIRQLQERASKATRNCRRTGLRSGSDAIAYMHRRVQRASAELERHISHHNCQE